MSKLTITEVIKRKEVLNNRKSQEENVELFIPSLEANIVIKVPSKSLCMEALEMTNNGKVLNNADEHLVYNCIIEPDLTSQKLLEAFEVVEPMDILEILFKPGEISQIAAKCLEVAGYTSDVKMVKDLKN